jgi:flagellar hook-basal body complex protein FliE
MISIGSNLISNLNNIAGTLSPTKSPVSETGSEGSFKDILTEALQKLESTGDENAQAALDLLTGNTDDLSNTMIASQKTEIALELTVAIRNKAIDAYKEIMNMQV